MQNNYYRLTISINKEEEIYYAYCTELAGCYSQGESYEEAKKNIQEALNLYLETFDEAEAIAQLAHEMPAAKAVDSAFDVQLRLTSAQAEKLLLNAGFSLTGNKDNHRVYLKQHDRIILPTQGGKSLSQKMVKEIVDLTS